MGLSELTVRLLLLFFPGIVCYTVIEALTVHKEHKTHEVFLRAFMLGMLSYAVFAAALAICGIYRDGNGWHMPDPDVAFFRFLAVDAAEAPKTATPENTTASPQANSPKTPVRFFEIFWVAIVAVVLGGLLSAAINRHWFHKLAQRLRITKKFGQHDVWEFTFDAPETSWATVRDVPCNVMYQGYIRAYSDTDETREILLSDVNVYNEATGDRLYESDHVYLTRDRNNLTIELHNPPKEQTEWPTANSTGEADPQTESQKGKAKADRTLRTPVLLVLLRRRAAAERAARRNRTKVASKGDSKNGRPAKGSTTGSPNHSRAGHRQHNAQRKGESPEQGGVSTS